MESMKRININLPEHSYDDLQTLASQTGRTMTEVLRTGFGLAKIAMEEAREGRRLAVVNKDGKLIKDIVIAQ